MIAIIDACGAVEILLQREKAHKFRQILQESTLRVAPDLYVSELANAIWKYHSAKKITRDNCIQYIKQGLGLINIFVNANDIWEEAFSEGTNNKHSIYDMLYMVTARRNSGILITNDSALAAVCKKNHVQICF